MPKQREPSFQASSKGTTLIKMMKVMLQLEISNEKVKNELALTHDFNFQEAFAFLDVKTKHELIPLDLQEVLEK